VSFADHFSRQSLQYTQFRPRYPRELFAHLGTLVDRHDAAWDCGTGNGQAAVDLAEHFAHVFAIDPSTNQISHARSHPRVSYQVAQAEKCPLADNLVDLVTVAQALHWFDRDRFYSEVRRVGRPGSVLAAWCYGLAIIDPQIDDLVWQLYEPILGNYWPPERSLVEERYATIDFPFERLAVPELVMTAEWTLADLLGYLSTWSSVQDYRRQHGTDPLLLIDQELAAAWPAPDERRTVRWPLYGLIGRIHSGPKTV
jgi:SAM-dependent methyltransferase